MLDDATYKSPVPGASATLVDHPVGDVRTPVSSLNEPPVGAAVGVVSNLANICRLKRPCAPCGPVAPAGPAGPRGPARPPASISIT